MERYLVFDIEFGDIMNVAIIDAENREAAQQKSVITFGRNRPVPQFNIHKITTLPNAWTKINKVEDEEKEEVMKEYVKEKTAQESFLELADKVREGELAVTEIRPGPIEIYPEGRHRISIDLIEMPKIIQMSGYYKTKDLKDALVAGIDTKGHAFGKIHMSLGETAAAIWDKYGKNIYPDETKEFDLKL